MNETQSIEAIVAAIYDTISGPAGKPRDWTRFRSLFSLHGRLTRAIIAPDGTLQTQVMDVETYQHDTSGYFGEYGFYEKEISRRIDQFGCIAQVFSTYEARHEPDDPRPFKRGINSIQLFNDGVRWWVMSVLWDNERRDNPIPMEYLP